jgi:hypothetical protein
MRLFARLSAVRLDEVAISIVIHKSAYAATSACDRQG